MCTRVRKFFVVGIRDSDCGVRPLASVLVFLWRPFASVLILFGGVCFGPVVMKNVLGWHDTPAEGVLL